MINLTFFWIGFLAAVSAIDTKNKGIKSMKELIIPPGAEFKIVRNSPFFVDKTLYIKEWLLSGFEYHYITAPPHFGKSTLLNMMYRFLDADVTIVNGSVQTNNRNETEDHQLFVGTHILEREKMLFYKHFKQYTVIYASFAGLVNVTNFESFKRQWCQIVFQMYDRFSFLKNYSGLSDAHKFLLEEYGHQKKSRCLNDFEDGLSVGEHLEEILQTVLKRDVIFLVDDYDSILHAHLSGNVENWNDIMDDLEWGMRSFAKNEMGIKWAKRLLLVGLFSGSVGGAIPPLVDTIVHSDFFHDENTAKYFGVSEEEAKELLAKFSLSRTYNAMKEWFDGYTVLESDLHLFNFVSVIRYITNGQKLEACVQPSPVKLVIGQLLPLISDHLAGHKIAVSIYGGSAVICIPSLFFLSSDLVKLKQRLNCAAGPNGDYQITFEEVSVLMTILLEFGLFAVEKEKYYKDRTRFIKAPNRESMTILKQILRESRYLDNEFKLDERQKRGFKNAVKRLQPKDESVHAFGEAVYQLFFKNRPYEKYPYVACLHTYACEASEEEKGAFQVDGGVRLYKEVANEKNVIVRTVNGTVDFVAYWKGKLIVIIDVECEHPATAGLDHILRMRYYQDLTKTDGFSNMTFEHYILMGLSIFSEMGTFVINYLIDSLDVKDSFIFTRDQNGSKVQPWRDMKSH